MEGALALESSWTSPRKGASPASFMSPISRADAALKRTVSASSICTAQTQTCGVLICRSTV